LFRDIDKALSIDKYRPTIYGNGITNGISTSIDSPPYLAEGLFRFYSREFSTQSVLGINICIFDKADDLLISEPLFVVSHIIYSTETNSENRSGRAWDPWRAFLNWNTEPNKYLEALQVEIPKDKPHVEHVSVAATKLYDIQKLDSALSVINLVKPAEIVHAE
jgi:hypothetical protein